MGDDGVGRGDRQLTPNCPGRPGNSLVPVTGRACAQGCRAPGSHTDGSGVDSVTSWPAALYAAEDSSYSFLLGAELKPRP